MTNTTRTTRIHVMPAGAPIFDERAWSVEIEDESGGEYVTVMNGGDKISIDPSEWPALREAIDRMISECTEELK